MMRKIDQDTSVKTKPMRLLVLGVSRTGTSSLCLALDKLGYKTYHMNENLAQPRRFFPLWIEALNAKYRREGKPFGKPEFDKILADYDALSDLPAILFADELLEAYPSAKVILTTRDPDKWLQSMQETIYLVHSWSSWDWLARTWDPNLMGLWRECDTMDWDAFLGQEGRRDYLTEEYGELAKRRFVEHNQHVKKVVARDRLLEHRPQDGWGPLCEFLGHGVPGGEYPFAWDGKELVRAGRMLWWFILAKAVATTVLPVCAILGLWYWYGR